MQQTDARKRPPPPMPGVSTLPPPLRPAKSALHFSALLPSPPLTPQYPQASAVSGSSHPPSSALPEAGDPAEAATGVAGPSPRSVSCDLTMAPNFLSLPDDILIHICELVGADDASGLGCLAMTAKRFSNLLAASTVPWRAAFLARYDHPRLGVHPSRTIEWRSMLRARVLTERIMQNPLPDPSLTDDLAGVILGMVLDMPPQDNEGDEGGDEGEVRYDDVERVIGDILCPPGQDRRLSRGEQRLEALLHSAAFSHLYRHGATGPFQRYDDTPVHQNGTAWYPRPRRLVQSPKLCRLHLLRADADPDRRGWLRSLVYCLDHMPAEAPFCSDGTVDWVQADAAGSLMYVNILNILVEGSHEWRSALPPLMGVRQLRGLAASDAVDWAGVTGVWNGAYAFMNYPDWVTLNDPGLSGLTPFDLTTYHENVGDVVVMVAETVASEAEIHERAPPDATLLSLDTALPTSDRFPPLYFFGGPGGGVAADADAFMYGVVRLTPDEQVRWTLVIHYDGRDQWLMSGVQIGGIGSARGWCGLWTDAQGDAETHGPVWYWKVKGAKE